MKNKTAIATTPKLPAQTQAVPVQNCDGTLVFVDYWNSAIREADRVGEMAIEDAPELRHDLSRLGMFGAKAFQSAIAIAASTRATNPEDTHPTNTVINFVEESVRLFVYLIRVEALEKKELWRKWLRTPGTTFSWKAGDSALHVALRFARMIHGAVNHHRLEMFGEASLDGLDVSPQPNERLTAWRQATIDSLREHVLPHLPAWPMWEIHRDREALMSKFAYEWEISVLDPNSPSYPVVAPLLTAMRNDIDSGARTPNGACLSPSERGILQVLETAGHRMTTSQILDTLTKSNGTASEGTTKNALASMVRNGHLTNRRDLQPSGYGLPDWV